MTTRSHSHDQLTLDRFFVPASEIATTDWALMEARLDWAQYDSKFRNFPRGKPLSTYPSDMIEKHPGITTKELIRMVGVPKTTVYDHVKYLIEEKHSVKKMKGGLYVIGSPPPMLVDWCYHNITVLFWFNIKWGVLNELCQFLNASDLFRNRERVARVWPPKREWRPIQRSRSIKVACTRDPLTYEEMGILRSLIWRFFKQKKQLRFTLDWMIIGAQTNPLVLLQREWIEALLKEAEDSDTKVSLKKIPNWHEDILNGLSMMGGGSCDTV